MDTITPPRNTGNVAMLNISNLKIEIGTKTIVNDISLQVQSDTFCAIIGPNGSGKTTTLRAITGDLKYTGIIEMNGADIAKTKAYQLASMRAVLPQASSLSFPFTVFEVIQLGLSLGIRTKLDEVQLVHDALQRVDLSGFGNRFYQELSGGEQQRAQLARVLVQVWEPQFNRQPRLLFLDEPISSLDIKHQIQIMDIAKDYSRRGGIVVAVLHDLNLTAAYADQVLLMFEGQTYSSGSVREVMTKTNLEQVYGCSMRVEMDVESARTTIIPDLKMATN